MNDTREIYRELVRITMESGGTAVLATVIATGDSTPRHIGAKMLIHQDGTLVGSIGGGAVEQAVINAAVRQMELQLPAQLLEYNLGDTADSGEKTGMICGGSMKIFLEIISGQDRLILFGGGHIARALAPLAGQCGFSVTVVDDRAEVADHFSSDVKLHSADPVEFAASLELRRSDSIVVITHNHKYDSDILLKLLARDHFEPRYIGMIGSRKKVAAAFRRMLTNGVAPERLQAVSAPIGLDIGAESPAELSIAILAEIIARKNKKITPDGVVLMPRIPVQE